MLALDKKENWDELATDSEVGFQRLPKVEMSALTIRHHVIMTARQR